MSDEPFVTCAVEDGVALLTLNRPERNNGWSVPMGEEYYGLLARCAEDPAVRVVVVTGAGRSFCPGLDLQTLTEISAGEKRSYPHRNASVTTTRTVPKPVIAAINGACAGIGLAVALNVDLRFASSTAKLTTAFARRGLMAEHGTAWSLQNLIGPSKALDLLLSARVVQGEEALRLGLVDRIFDPEDLLGETLAYACDLAANCSPLSMGLIKRQVYAAQQTTHEEARELSFRLWYELVQEHHDLTEGVASFREHRAPDFAPWDPSTTADPAPLPE